MSVQVIAEYNTKKGCNVSDERACRVCVMSVVCKKQFIRIRNNVRKIKKKGDGGLVYRKKNNKSQFSN